VKAAGFANQLPMVQLRDTFGVRKAPSTRPPSSTDGADARFVSRGYLAAMGVRVVEGRGFREEDRPERSRVVLINEALARRDFGGQNPLGTSVYIGSDPRPWQIVGIVDDVRQFGLEREAEPQFFADLRQSSGVGPLFPLGAYYVVRIGGEPEAIVSSVRTIVRDMEPNGALFNVAPMNALVAATIARPRMYAVLLGIFAAVGVVLALVGIYGVVAYAVTQRTREIGIRMALGARRGEVMRMVLRQALTIVAAGILVGLLGGAATTRYLEGLLFGVTPLDPATFAAASIAFALIAAFASYLPARRATRVDPVVAIRSE
jgi:predicted permease